MRAVILGLTVGLAANSAAAQSEMDWGGGYAGVAFSAQAASDGDFKTIIDPGLDSRLTYTVLPPERSYSAEALERSVAPVIFAGWRREVGGWVVGVEGQVQVGGPQASLDSDFVTSLLNRFNACDATGRDCLGQTSDRIEADLDVRNVLSLRAAAGKQIGDRMLLSAYAGPALGFAQLAMVQTSTYGTSRFDPSCTRFCVNQPTSVTETRGRTEEDTALGVVVGVTADFAITNALRARADVGYHRFEAFRGSVGGTNGGDSEVRAQSAAASAGLGLSLQF